MLKKLADYLLACTILLFSLGSIGRISPFENEVGVYVYEVVMSISILVLFLSYRFHPLRNIDNHLKPLFLFLLYVIINYLFLIFDYTASQNVIGFLYTGRLILYVLFAFYTSYHVSKHKQSSLIMRSLIVFVVVTILSAFIQYYLYPDLRNLSYLEWDPHLNRMFGVFLDPFLSAAVYGLVLLLFYFRGPQLVKNKYVRIALCFILITMFFLTYSRGAYLALFVTGFIFVLRQKRYILLSGLIAIFAMALTLLMIPSKTGEGMNLLRTSTIVTRIEDYKTAFDIWRRSPIVGFGYNRIRYEKVKLAKDGEVSIMKSHSGASFHSSFLIILVSTGVIGIVLFLYALITLARMNDLIAYSTIFLAVFSLTDNVLLHPIVVFLLVMYVSLFTLSDR